MAKGDLTLPNHQPPYLDNGKTALIKQLLQLRVAAKLLGLRKVAICLDYAYYEALAFQDQQCSSNTSAH